MKIYRIITLIIFLNIIVPNVNAIFKNKWNFTLFDRLDIKKGIRNRILNYKTAYSAFINPIYNIHNDKSIQNLIFNPLIYGYTSSQFDNITLNKFNSILLAQNNRPLDERWKSKGYKPGISDGSEYLCRNESYGKGVKLTKKGGERIGESKESEFRDKEKMDEKLLEYESLMSEINQLSKSKEKTDKDLYSFIKKNLREASTDPNIKLTTKDISRAIVKERKLKDLDRKRMLNMAKIMRAKIAKRLEGRKEDLDIRNPVDVNLETKAKEDSCGFRYPIDGKPEDIYSDPNVYKFWGRTPLSQAQTTHPIGFYRGKIEKKEPKLADLVKDTTGKYDKILKETLGKVRESRFEEGMDNVFTRKRIEESTFNTEDAKNNVSLSEEYYKFKNAEFKNYYEAFKEDFLNSKPNDQEQILKSLNPYNPWDEYIKIKNLKSSLPPMGVNYKIDLKTLGVTFNTNDTFPEEDIKNFLREYLHYFLILKTDENLFEEFKKSRFLNDILQFFDINSQIIYDKRVDPPNLADEFYKLYFPKECPDGFPKPPPSPEFPLTIEDPGLISVKERISGKGRSYNRVNIFCSLLALAKCFRFVRSYSSDIFSEQRIKLILETIETGLMLEMKRLEYGISEIRINNLEYTGLCEVNGVFLSTLSDILVQWNIRHGIENITDLILLITLKKLNEIKPKFLVNIVRNISYLTTLPHDVYSKFLGKIVDFIHEKLKFSLVNKVKWMDFGEALDFLSVISNYREVVTRPFMEAFMQLYKESIISLRKDLIKNRVCDIDFRDDNGLVKTDLRSKMENIKLRIMPLVSCLQFSDLTEHMYLLDELTNIYTSEDFVLNSTVSISILDTFNEHDEFQNRVISRIKYNLISTRYQMGAEGILKCLHSFIRGVKESRLEPDGTFIWNMLRNFCSHQSPDSDQLIDAARLTTEFSPNLTKKQLHDIFEDLTARPLCFHFLTRLGLQGENLEYPLSTIIQVLYYSSKNKVIIEKNWRTFNDFVYLFKHLLSIEADEMLDILCKRVCNLMEVMNIEPQKIFDIMDKCLELDYIPMNLLRFYIYSSMFHLQGPDHVTTLLEEPKDYDVDFRGWKRPLTYDKHVERIKMDHNVYPEIKMEGSRAKVPPNLRYSMQTAVKKPREFEPIKRDEVDKKLLKKLVGMVTKVSCFGHEFSERDRNLIDSLKDLVGVEGLYF